MSLITKLLALCGRKPQAAQPTETAGGGTGDPNIYPEIFDDARFRVELARASLTGASLQERQGLAVRLGRLEATGTVAAVIDNRVLARPNGHGLLTTWADALERAVAADDRTDVLALMLAGPEGMVRRHVPTKN
jgi:hypothetical protein